MARVRQKEEDERVVHGVDTPGGDRPVPTAPSFGMCEGVRTDLEQVDKTTDPFTGKTVTRDEK